MQISLVGTKTNKLVVEGLDIADTSKFGQFILQTGLTPVQVGSLVIYMQPLWEEYLLKKLNDSLSLADVFAIEKVGGDGSMDEDQKQQMVLEMYKLRTGKTVEDEFKILLDALADAMTRAINEWNEILKELNLVSSDQWETKMDELVSGKLKTYFDQLDA